MQKQVIVMRHDLKMRMGKVCSQGAHASLLAILNYKAIRNENTICLDISDYHEWLDDSFYTKVTVRVESEEELLSVYANAKNKGIICSLVQDAGKTEFHGVPTYTCCAIGPWDTEVIDTITGHLKLL